MMHLILSITLCICIIIFVFLVVSNNSQKHESKKKFVPQLEQGYIIVPRIPIDKESSVLVPYPRKTRLEGTWYGTARFIEPFLDLR
jgi:hypothetical protein